IYALYNRFPGWIAGRFAVIMVLPRHSSGETERLDDESKDQDGGSPINVLLGTICNACCRRLAAPGGALAVSLAIAGLVFAGCSKSSSGSVRGDDNRPTSVRLYTVAEETAHRRIQAVGSLHALEESTLSAEVEARVSQVLADVGDAVKEGQPLIVLDPQELQFELQRQRGIVQQVRAQLGIGPNDPLPSDPKKIASVLRAEADLFDADRKNARAQEMFKEKLISQQQLDEAASR